MKIANVALLSISILAALAAGCVSKQKEPALPPPPTAAQFEALKTNIITYNSSAKVGIITAVLESDALVSIGDAAVEGLRRGDVFSVVDGERNVVANATVQEINDGRIIASYKSVNRAPVVGDAAVKF